MGNSAPTPPDPTQAAIAGIQDNAAEFPYSYIVNALAQTGGDATLPNPSTGQPQNLDFTGLGTADVQNQVSAQMAQTLLDIQKGLGSQYIAQRLADLQQADPTGYAAYGQLFDQIQQEAAQNPPDQPLSTAVQSSINGILQGSNQLTPEELTQVQQQTRAGNLASGVYLGNAPAQAEATNVVSATDQKNSQAQGAASQYLSEGITPADIQYRQIQQDLENYGAFENGQNPTAEFSSLSGAQQGAAPDPNTGYVAPTLNESQGAEEGLANANQLFTYQNELSQGTANPYLAGLNIATQGLTTANNLYNSFQTPNTQAETALYNFGSAYNPSAFASIGNTGGSGLVPTDVSSPDLSDFNPIPVDGQ